MHLGVSDIVRHKIVSDIVAAYDQKGSNAVSNRA